MEGEGGEMWEEFVVERVGLGLKGVEKVRVIGGRVGGWGVEKIGG